MSIISLPTEISLNIATFLGQNDHLSLVSVCKSFYDIFLQALYSSLTVRLPGAHRNTSDEAEISKFAEELAASMDLVERLETHSTIRRSVHSIYIVDLAKRRYIAWGVWEDDPDEPDYDALVGAIVRALAGLPVLKEVTFTSCELHVKWVLYLAGQSSQPLGLRLSGTCLYGVPDGTPIEVKACSLSLRGSTPWRECRVGLAQFLRGPLLRVLDARPLSGVLHDAFVLLGRPSLPQLHSLSVVYLKRDELGVLRALPNLRELMFYGLYQFWSTEDLPVGEGGERVLGALETIAAHRELLPCLTAARNITSITTESPTADNAQDFERLEKWFGSQVMVRTVHWKYCMGTEELLDYLIAKNPGVWNLIIDPLNVLPTQEAVMSFIPKLVQLRELRTLECPVLTDVSDEISLSWEKQQCEHLRQMGSPFLVSVAFRRDITWTRNPDDETFRASL